MKAFKIRVPGWVVTGLIITLLSPAALFGSMQPAGNPVSVASDGILTKSDAEKIIGQPAKLTDEKTEVKDGITSKSLTYTALENEPNRMVNLYYSLKQYANEGLAKKAYSDIVTSNARMPGHSLLSGIGDEAWYHTDSENFSLIMVRKNNKLMLMKISKMTKKFSKQELQDVSRRIMG